MLLLVYTRDLLLFELVLHFRFKWILTWKIHCAVFVTGLLVHTFVVISTASSTTVAPVGNGNMPWMPLPIIAHSHVPPSQVAHSKMTIPSLVRNEPLIFQLFPVSLSTKRQQRFLICSRTFIIILFLFITCSKTFRFNRYNLFNKVNLKVFICCKNNPCCYFSCTI